MYLVDNIGNILYNLIIHITMWERGSKMKKDYILGLDIGISSVGWGLLKLDDNNNPIK